MTDEPKRIIDIDGVKLELEADECIESLSEFEGSYKQEKKSKKED